MHAAAWPDRGADVGDRMPRSMSRRVLPIGLIALTLMSCADQRSGPTAPSSPFVPGIACGVERWAVKTLSDPDATRVQFSPVVTTSIRELNALPTRCRELGDRRTADAELRVYEVVGRVVLARLEDDRDIHLALADPSDRTITIVTEVVDPVCQGATESPFRTSLLNAKDAFSALAGPGRSLTSLAGRLVRVRGVGFYDVDHAQTGRSQSCLELHPVLAVESVAEPS